MNTDTGHIINPEAMELFEELKQKMPIKKMNLSPTPEQLSRQPPKVSLNDYCPCGSNKKFKNCCYTGN